MGTLLQEIPASLQALIGVAQYHEQAAIDVDRASIRNACAAVQNANPMYWDAEFANNVAGAEIAPFTMLSTWLRPFYWNPNEEGQQLALQAHFDVKEMLALPDAIITENALEFGCPVAVGDSLSSYQQLQSISEIKKNRLGVGRYWLVDIIFENQNGQFVGRDSYTAFGYDKTSQATT